MAFVGKGSAAAAIHRHPDNSRRHHYNQFFPEHIHSSRCFVRSLTVTRLVFIPRTAAPAAATMALPLLLPEGAVEEPAGPSQDHHHPYYVIGSHVNLQVRGVSPPGRPAPPSPRREPSDRQTRSRTTSRCRTPAPSPPRR